MEVGGLQESGGMEDNVGGNISTFVKEFLFVAKTSI